MKNIQKNNDESNGYWFSISDLMSGLMIVFLFISVAFMRESHNKAENSENARKKIENIALAYKENQEAIYLALNNEFEYDLKKWNASIDNTTLSFQFNAPEVLFDAGKSEINNEFQNILSDFIPRYLNVLKEYKNSIDEIRIEGHTSSEWHYKANDNVAYFFNMKLSQDRTRSVLEYAYMIPNITNTERKWIKESFAAVGFSSSKILKNDDGSEDKKRSRRVTFRVITNADMEIRKIISGI